MVIPRLTVQGLMVVVAVAAVDLVVARSTLSEYRRPDLEMVITIVPMLLLNLAAWGVSHRARPGRAFWVGYLVAGGLVMGSWVWMHVQPMRSVPAPDGSGITIRQPSLPHACWETIIIAPLDALEALWRDVQGRKAPRWLRSAVGYPYAVALHVVPAVLGGLIARWSQRRRGARRPIARD